MADEVFAFSWVPNGYGARLQRNAVLYELTGNCGSAEEIIAGTQRLVGMWRARLHGLSETGWRPGYRGKDMQYLRNCPPTFVRAAPHTRQCKLRHFCPFCYARWVRKVWERIDTTFPNPRSEAECAMVAPQLVEQPDDGVMAVEFVGDDDVQDRPLRAINLDGEPCSDDVGVDFPYHMLTRKIEKSHPFSRDRDGESQHDYAVHLLSKLAEARAFTIRKMGTLGSFAFTTLVPCDSSWTMLHREMHIVPASYELPENIKGVVKRITNPSRKRIFQAVAKACKYPRELLFGDADLVKIALEARRGLRLSASYGVFRHNNRSSRG